jgi:hypothetical protein
MVPTAPFVLFVVISMICESAGSPTGLIGISEANAKH